VIILFYINERMIMLADIKYDIVVAKDGSGDFETVQAAVDSIPENNAQRVTVYLKKGTYKEKIRIPENKPYITFVGEDVRETILTFDDAKAKRHADGTKYENSEIPSSYLFAADFTAHNITFENTASNKEPAGQAMAAEVRGDRMVFENCRFLGHQDTLLADGTGRQYYKNCYITGTVDFIYGSATAVFDECEIFSRDRHNGYITAPSTSPEQKYGFVFLNCELVGEAPQSTVYLGRPWRPYGSTAYINCYMDDHIRHEGWNNWRDESREKTARFAEYNSRGPGANISGRVEWSRQLTDEEAKKYTVKNILSGNDGWDPIKLLIFNNK